MVRLAEDLLLLARDDDSPTLRMTSFDLVALVQDAIRSATVPARARRVVIRSAGEPTVQVFAEPDRIRRAIENLLTNAVRFSPSDGTVVVTTTADGPWVQVAVADTGPGFPLDFLPVAFERFTRADHEMNRSEATPGGYGLGLAIVRSAMAAHGGTAQAANNPDGGAVVTLRWPANAVDGAHRTLHQVS